MSSYLSNLLTTTTSRYASIKQTLLASEVDGETEDDTNVCRVLRSYYTEKGRPFPGWLPPDPKAPAPAVQPVYTQPNIGAGYGGFQAQPGGTSSSRLNSLWDAGRGGQVETQSLRSGTSGGRSQRSPFDRAQTASEPPVQQRPSPSERTGSYQPSTLGGADRLKARFGNKSSTPRATGSNGYNNTNSGGGGSYEDSLAPGNYNTSARPSSSASSAAGSYGRDSAGSAPARVPPGGGRMGLPSGPGAARNGLPSGPRSMR